MDSNPSDAFVSIVTPFYNTANYLTECIESVLTQSHQNFEYLLVDNQSTDGSAEIARQFAGSDPRIRYIRNANFVDQVANYNGALTAVSSDARYIKLVQADDFLLPDCVTAMVAVADANPSVGLVSSYYMKGNRVTGDGIEFGVTVTSGREVCRLMLLSYSFPLGSPTSVLYRADIVRARSPFFATGRHHEDTEAAYEILQDHDFGFVHQVLSFLRTDRASTLAKMQSYNGGVLDRLIVLERFGPLVLDPHELQSARRAEWAAYYGYLGNCVLARRGRAFWAFHRHGLATIGVTLHRRVLVYYTARAGLSLLLNPLDTVTGRWRELRSLNGQWD